MYSQDFLAWDTNISGYHLIQEQDKKQNKTKQQKNNEETMKFCRSLPWKCVEITMGIVQVQDLRTDSSASLQLLL